jgi:hypothetical protein
VYHHVSEAHLPVSLVATNPQLTVSQEGRAGKGLERADRLVQGECRDRDAGNRRPWQHLPCQRRLLSEHHAPFLVCLNLHHQFAHGCGNRRDWTTKAADTDHEANGGFVQYVYDIWRLEDDVSCERYRRIA